MNKELARIKSTRLGYEDHGIFTHAIDVEYDSGMCQSIGMNIMDTPIPYDKEKEEFKGREGTAYGMDCIIGILKGAGVEKWEDLPGKYIWVISNDDNKMNSMPIGIMRVFAKYRDKPYYFKETAQKHGLDKEK